VQEPVYPMAFLRCRPIGLMQMIDQGEQDDKIIAVAIDDPEYRDIRDIASLPRHRLAEVRRFFEDYKKNENKIVRVDEFQGPEEAIEAIKKAIEGYKEKFGALRAKL